MKSVLLAALLLPALPTLAQTTTAAAPPAASSPVGLEALDAKNGFRSYKFGTPLSALPDLQPRDDYYINPFEARQLEGVELDKLIQFYARDGKLCGVLLTLTSAAQPNPLFALLSREFGSPQTVTTNKWVWTGQRVTATYSELMVTANMGYVGIPVRRGQMLIETNEAAAARRVPASKATRRRPGTLDSSF